MASRDPDQPRRGRSQEGGVSATVLQFRAKRARSIGGRLVALVATLFAMAPVLVGLSARADTTTFVATQDAFVSTKYPSSNFGGWTELRVDTSQRITYVQFSVTALTGPAGQAALRLYENDSSASGFQVHLANSSSWTDAAITANNAPGYPTAVVGSSGPTAPGWTSADV